MSSEHDPDRLFEGGGDPDVATLLQTLRADGPDAARVEALARAVEQAAAGGVAGSTASGLSNVVKLKAAKLLALLAVSGGALWLATELGTPVDSRTGGPPTSETSARAFEPTFAEGFAQDDTVASTHEGSPTDTSASRNMGDVQPTPAFPIEVPTAETLGGKAATVDRATNDMASRMNSGAPNPASRAAHSTAAAHTNSPSSTAARPLEPARSRRAETSGDEAISAPPAAQGWGSELELLSQAQRALKTDATRALSLSREHQRAYPSGVFAEERDALMIDALARLGHASQARTLAARFFERYPRSSHQTRITTILNALH